MLSLIPDITVIGEFSEGDVSFTNSFKVSSALGVSIIGICATGSGDEIEGVITDSVLVSKVLDVGGDGAEADFGGNRDFDISGELLLGATVSDFDSGLETMGNISVIQ